MDVHTHAKRTPKRVACAKPTLKYYSLNLVCKFSGKPPQKRLEMVRKTKLFRQECPIRIYIVLSSNGQSLEVTSVDLVHNHVCSGELYEHQPCQRAAEVPHTMHQMREALQLQANSKLPKKKIEVTTGKKLTLKDISNVKQKTKKETNNNRLEDVVEYLRKQPGSITEVVIDNDDNFKGIFFQDSHMQGIYEKFPEVLLVDATYKLLDLRLPVFLLMCVNGDGLSEIAGMFILSEETKDVISATVDVFKKHKPAHSRTEVIMSDKDFTERDAFSCCFPNASLIICLYHTVRSFRRKIVCDKLGISSAERLHVLEILQAMATSRSASEYDKHLTSLKNTNMQSVIDYVLENWDPIKEQWVAYYKDKSFNRGETTNNRLESTFTKIKSVCSRYSNYRIFCGFEMFEEGKVPPLLDGYFSQRYRVF